MAKTGKYRCEKKGAEVVEISGLGLLGVQGERLRGLLWTRRGVVTSQVELLRMAHTTPVCGSFVWKYPGGNKKLSLGVQKGSQSNSYGLGNPGH